MKKIVSSLCVALAAFGFCGVSQAGIVLGKGDKCFQLGQTMPGAMRKTLKIHTNNHLTDRFGDMVAVSALEHGFQATNPPNEFLTQLSGTATFILAGAPQETNGKTQISLVGTHYGSYQGQNGLWTDDLSVNLNRQDRGSVSGGFLVGFTEFDPIVETTNDDVDEMIDNVQLAPISCKDF